MNDRGKSVAVGLLIVLVVLLMIGCEARYGTIWDYNFYYER